MSEKPPMHSTIGTRRFGRVNGPGLYTLTAREIHRFGKIWLQTILAPVVAALLFLVVFDLAFADQRSDINGVTFAAFLAPGMVMMAVIQNSFANTSSSVLHAKILGNIVDTVAAPLSPTELNIGYALGGAARGLTVAVATSVVLFPLVGTGFAQPLWAAYFVLAACLLLANIGIVTGMWAEKFDHTATVTNFIVTPLSFLSGTFLFGVLPARALERNLPLEPLLLPDRRLPLRRTRRVRRRAEHRAGRHPDRQSAGRPPDLAAFPDRLQAERLNRTAWIHGRFPRRHALPVRHCVGHRAGFPSPAKLPVGPGPGGFSRSIAHSKSAPRRRRHARRILTRHTRWANNSPCCARRRHGGRFVLHPPARFDMVTSVLPTYARAPLEFVRGQGVWLFDSEDERYLDLGGGIAVNLLGHAHPHLVDALKAQAEKLWHTSNLYRIPGQECLARRLTDNSFADKVFFTNSGAEAVETAIKMARKHHSHAGAPERYRIITFDGAFHGRTLATIAAVGKPKLVDGFGPMPDGFDVVPFDDADAVGAAVTGETAGVLLEPIQGEGGIRPFSTATLQKIRKICDTHGILLLLDEVQCGMGRTGCLFAHELHGIQPDILATAKGLGGGFPVGACLATTHAAAGMTVGSHGSTFGGNPLAMAVGNAVLDIVLEDGFLETRAQDPPAISARAWGPLPTHIRK